MGDRSVPLGKYCLSSRLVFSFVPRCQGLCGSQKYTFTSVATVNALCLAISNPPSRHQQTVNAARCLAVGTPNFMQRLPRLPSPPNICSLRSRKSRPLHLLHKHHPFNRRSSTRTCCVDRLNPPTLSPASRDRVLAPLSRISCD